VVAEKRQGLKNQASNKAAKAFLFLLLPDKRKPAVAKCPLQAKKVLFSNRQIKAKCCGYHKPLARKQRKSFCEVWQKDCSTNETKRVELC
jgi:hypothetical protein